MRGGADSELPKGKCQSECNGQLANCLRANSALCPTDNTIIEYEYKTEKGDNKRLYD